jgi:uncharacterized protein
MLVAAVAGLSVGVGVGALMTRGGVCFNAGVREAVAQRKGRILRIFGVAVGLQLLALPLIVELGVPVSAPALLPVAQVAGGLAFGCGMALAGGCITGVLWKAGSGSVATAIAIGGFAIGELAIRGPWDDLPRRLDITGPQPSSNTLNDAIGVSYTVAALALGLLTVGVLLWWSRAGVLLGLGLGALGVAAWVAADWADYGYGLGFVGSAENVQQAIEAGDASRLSMAPFLALGVVLGAAAAMRGRLRRPDAARAGRALAGGVLMGVGGTLAHGCNIGHGLTGVPLLSLGSVVAISAMAVGAAATWRLALRDHSALRGSERPAAPDW